MRESDVMVSYFLSHLKGADGILILSEKTGCLAEVFPSMHSDLSNDNRWVSVAKHSLGDRQPKLGERLRMERILRQSMCE